ncbi:DUF2513 domain-containing protein [Bacillus safensis]|uniref:DUF2513 domain-containing protein n=1 Tax=Bacillus safensis TaxID=561879 RepID=UPI0022811D1A|nr:DUF2513 domain-containing protein [Bacillus safensis]MCY7492806.1 DUF2513 domain-containing protein [Bacillus safensis]MED4992605.1 DUF2513 domain-containing protein [Bacillus safensis]
MITIKRDMELFRKILIKLEEDESPSQWKSLDIEGVEDTLVSYHIKLLTEAGMIDGKDKQLDQYFWWQARNLTSQGHDLLDSLRNDTVYNKMKEILGEKISQVPLSEILKLGTKLTNQWLSNLFG